MAKDMLEEQEQENTPQPSGERVLQLVARPKDANRFGDIYAGWLIDQMDQAAEIVASRYAGRCATVSIEQLDFSSPVPVGSQVEVFAEPAVVGRSSIKIPLEAWVDGGPLAGPVKVTQATWVVVDIQADGHIKAL